MALHPGRHTAAETAPAPPTPPSAPRASAPWLGALIAIIVAPVLAAAAIIGGTLGLLAVVGLLGLLIGVYIGLQHPLWLFWGLAVVLAGLPFGYFPGVHVPLWIPFAGGAVLAALVHPTQNPRFHRLELAVLLLMLLSALSVVFTMTSTADITQYIKWAASVAVMLALLRLSSENLAKFGRIFVYTATANALFGMAVVGFDPTHRFINIFGIFGYSQVETGRFFYGEDGVVEATRLGGTWVDPNAAGIALVLALGLAVLLLAGRVRVLIVAILALAVLMTLSRAALFSILVGVALLVAFHAMNPKVRQLLVGGLALAALAALLVPTMRTRIFSSFGSADAGAADRGRALDAYPEQMSGSWLFGLGWARREFTDGAYSWEYNIVANAPLIAIYRGGILVGAVFIAILVMGIVLGFRAILAKSLPQAVFGAFFIGLCLVALQLDHPVVHLPQTVLTFSVFLAFLVYVDRRRQLEALDGAPGSELPAASRTT